MTNLQHIAQELAEEFAPLVIGQSGTTKTFTAEQASALYHILVGFGLMIKMMPKYFMLKALQVLF
jgi:hypothetical protein